MGTKRKHNTKFFGKIMTVTGAVEPDVLGLALPHEHVMSTFGAESARYPFYDLEKLLDQVLPYLEKVKSLGCQALVDCTATHFGRHPELLRTISKQSRIHLLTNTGYYGAAEDKYIPLHAFQETADQIAARWTREWLFSIDDTGVRPGFIKTAVDEGPLSDIDRKLIVAAARTHLQTGLTIQTHVGDNAPVAQEILNILAEEKIHPGAWVWTHAHQVEDLEPLLQAADRGAWVSLDGINDETASHVLAVIDAMKDQGFLSRLLLSHDGDSYFGEGEFRPYHYLFTDFIPQMKSTGLLREEIEQMTVINVREAFTVGIKLL